MAPTPPVATPHNDTARQAAQTAEAEARARAGTAVPAGETEAALDAPSDTPQDPAAGARTAAPASTAEPAPEPRQPPKVGSAFDNKRNDIIARFRKDRTTAAGDGTDEIADFTRSGGMPEEYRQFDQALGADAPADQPAGEDTAAAAEPAPPAAEPAAAPPAADQQMVEINVRGEKKLVPLAEALGKAQIAYAADDTLEAAKARYREAEAALSDARNRVQRGDSSGQHQAGDATHPAEPGLPAAGDPPNTTEDPYEQTVQAIQFGDPAEAKTLLRNTIAKETEAATRKVLAEQSVTEDVNAAKKAIADFSKDHPEIANDARARAVMETFVFDQQAEDLTRLGVDFNKIRTDGQSATPADIANYHRLLRANGYDVRAPADMLTASHDKYLEWRGIKPTEPAADPPLAPPAPQQPQQQRSTAPRIVVNVDRQQRRQAAPPPSPQQPRPAQQPAARPADRSDVVKAMQQRNAQRRGQTLGLQS